MPFVFRILFPQDPLVDLNHTAAVDAIQTAQILRLLAELTKSPKERNLPEGLLQGFQKLAWLEDNDAQSNTLDRYFESIRPGASDTAFNVDSGGSNRMEVDHPEVEDKVLGGEKVANEDDGEETNDDRLSDENVDEEAFHIEENSDVGGEDFDVEEDSDAEEDSDSEENSDAEEDFNVEEDSDAEEDFDVEEDSDAEEDFTSRRS